MLSSAIILRKNEPENSACLIMGMPERNQAPNIGFHQTTGRNTKYKYFRSHHCQLFSLEYISALKVDYNFISTYK
jgi:hypothetical protein